MPHWILPQKFFTADHFLRMGSHGKRFRLRHLVSQHTADPKQSSPKKANGKNAEMIRCQNKNFSPCQTNLNTTIFRSKNIWEGHLERRPEVDAPPPVPAAKRDRMTSAAASHTVFFLRRYATQHLFCFVRCSAFSSPRSKSFFDTLPPCHWPPSRWPPEVSFGLFALF